MAVVVLVSRRRGQQQRCYPAATRIAIMGDHLVNADTGEVIVIRVNGQWWRQSDLSGPRAAEALGWEYPMVVDGVVRG